LYCTSSRCTRARVAAETSARSSSTWRRWPATHRRRRNGFQGGAAVPGHSSTPFRWPQRPWNRAGRSSSRRVTRSVSMLDSHHEHWTNRTKGAASRMPLKRLDEHVDATKVGAYCASKNGSFARHRRTLDGGLERVPYLRSSWGVMRRSSKRPAGQRWPNTSDPLESKISKTDQTFMTV
jgi:hypothetical protein